MDEGVQADGVVPKDTPETPLKLLPLLWASVTPEQGRDRHLAYLRLRLAVVNFVPVLLTVTLRHTTHRVGEPECAASSGSEDFAHFAHDFAHDFALSKTLREVSERQSILPRLDVSRPSTLLASLRLRLAALGDAL